MKSMSKTLLITLIAAPLAMSFAIPQVVYVTAIAQSIDQEAKQNSGAFKIVDKFIPPPKTTAILQKQEADKGHASTQEQGSITIQGSNTSYATLEEAINEANDGAVLEISGRVVINKDVAIGKNVTLKAKSKDAVISTNDEHRTNTQYRSGTAYSILLNSGKTLTLGDGAKTNELLFDEVHVEVTKGKLVLQDGVKISSNLPSDAKDSSVALSNVTISGSESSAEFKGGIVENPHTGSTSGFNSAYLVRVQKCAQVSEISGGTYQGGYIAFIVEDEGTKVEKITGGVFEHSDWTGQSEPCFKIQKKARVDKITGGIFTAYHFGALQLESGASVGEISGGMFQSSYDQANAKMSASSGAIPFCAGLTLYGRNGDSPVVVEKISGGTFTGVNGVLAVGNEPQQMTQINAITGGTFSSFDSNDGDAGLYFTQNSKVGEISGNVTATGHNNGIWNAGTITKISSGTYTGKRYDGLQNIDLSKPELSWETYFKGYVVEIAGGSFIGKKRGIVNTGVIDTISNGVFVGEDHAIACSNKTTKGQLSTIKNGVFYAKNGHAIVLVSTLTLEPDLGKNNEESGLGRYYAPESTAIFNDESKVTYPSYTEGGESKKYVMSKAEEGKKDVSGYVDTAFRYLKGPVKPSNLNAAPVLQLQDKTIVKGSSFDLKSLIVSATDAEDGDLKANVKMVSDGGFDANKVGTYTVTFKVSDSNGASVTMSATVTVKEKKPDPDPDPDPNPNPPAPTPEPSPSPTPQPRLPETNPFVDAPQIKRKTRAIPQTGASIVPAMLLSVLAFAIAGFGFLYKNKMTK